LKKRKSLTEMKKEAIAQKLAREAEMLCRRCGLCCHVKVGLSDGRYVVHPLVTCKYLNPDNTCSVYESRFTVCDRLCFTREEMLKKDYILPEGCPYTKLREGYKSALVVSLEEFEELMLKEIEAGNYNVFLANRAF